MRIVSPLLKRVVYPSFAKAGIFRHAARSGLAIITYHGILPSEYKSIDAVFDGNLITAGAFRRQLRLLKANYNVIAPDEMLAWCEAGRILPPRAVLLTCDDGLLNNLTDMLPILLEEHCQCLFFVTGASAAEKRSTLWYEDLFRIFLHAPAGEFEISCEGITLRGELSALSQRRKLWWDSVKRLSQLTAESRAAFLHKTRDHFGVGDHRPDDIADVPTLRRFGLLTRTELQHLANASMTIGAHTMSHPMLSRLAPELAIAEITESRSTLESTLGGKVWAFAYPFGDAQSVTSQVIAQTRAAGFQSAFLNFGGGLGAELPPHALPRIHVTAETNLAEFEAHVAGFYASMQKWTGRHRPNELQVA